MPLALEFKRRVKPYSNVRRLLSCCLLVVSLSVHAQNRGNPNTINPQDLYAAFLTKFPHFVEWPQSAGRRARSTIRLGVIGKDTFSKGTRDLIEKQKVGGKPFKVVDCKSTLDFNDLDILYIGSSEAHRIEEIVSAATGKGILTIGAIQDLAKRGGMINIARVAGKTHFKINLKAVNKNRIKISTKLLRSASIVD